MCGIAGFYKTALDKQDLTQMTRAIAHRGPDGEGLFFHEPDGLGLGHRRLSILDLSDAASQPMLSADGNLILIFNGEIYNYKELQTELTNLGCVFKTRSDTEVILFAYQKWGIDAFSKMNGMWSIALFDYSKKQLLLCLDRYGVKPLFYSRKNGGILFSSELKSFWPLTSKLGLKLSKTSFLKSLLFFGSLEEDGETLLQDVFCLKGGEYILMGENQYTHARWWDQRNHIPAPPKNYPEANEEFKELFKDSCKLRLRSDVPVGTSLSGGLDSSSVVGMVSRLRKENPSSLISHLSFIHRFPGHPIDETEDAKKVIAFTDSTPVWIEPDYSNLASTMDDHVLAFESVYPSIVEAAYSIYKKQRENGIYVTLDGHGGDEVLGGYFQYSYGILASSLLKPNEFSKKLSHLKSQAGRSFRWRNMLVGTTKALLENTATKSLVEKSKIYFSSTADFIDKKEASKIKRPKNTYTAPKDFSRLNRMLFDDTFNRVLPRILKNFDLASMHSGVEVRMPFLDYRLVGFSFSLPDDYKISEGFSKKIVRDSMRGIIPEEIRMKKLKLGLQSPMIYLMKNPLKEWILSCLNRPASTDSFIDRNRTLNEFQEFLLNPHVAEADAGKLWSVITAIRLSQLLKQKFRLDF